MEVLREVLKQLDLPHDDGLLKKYETYMNGILSWNEKINLTAIKDKKEFVQKHFVDSLLCAGRSEYKSAQKIIDVGTGGGFPGIPLALCSPEKEFVLMDSLNKKLTVIDDLCSVIGISNVTTIHARVEDMGHMKEHREQYDLCVSRAVAGLSVLCEYCVPLVKERGAFFAYKGPGYEVELEEAGNSINLLGGTLTHVHKAELQGSGTDHRILIIKKEAPTPSKYPRKAGMPSKKPLK